MGAPRGGPGGAGAGALPAYAGDPEFLARLPALPGAGEPAPAPVPSGFAPPAAKAGGPLGYTAPRFPGPGAGLDQVGGPTLERWVHAVARGLVEVVHDDDGGRPVTDRTARGSPNPRSLTVVVVTTTTGAASTPAQRGGRG